LTTTLCVKCQTPLVALLPARSTVPVPEALREGAAEPPKPKTKRFDDKLALYVLGHGDPVLIEPDVKKITLGRASPGESSPTIDLTRFDGHLLGVSRLHLTLYRSDNGCYVQDGSSTNGSWLNDKRLMADKLYEIKSGDLLRLGQLGMHVYFETRRTEYTFALMDEVSPGQRITPVYLDTRITPYLIALANVQVIIDTLHERPPTNTTVRSLMMEDDGRIVIVVSGARDALEMIETRLAEWRTARMIVVERLRTLNEQVKNQQDDGAKQALRLQSEPLLREVRSQLAEFARAFVDGIAPALSETLRATYTDKLVPPLQALLFSPLQLTQDEPESKDETPAREQPKSEQ
jgi:hypothetical protein